MKKSNILKFSFLLAILILKLLLIQHTVIADEIPTGPDLGPLTGIEMDPSTGLPVGFGKFQEIADNLSSEEKKEQYIKQEWAKLFANNKYLGPPLYYTTNFFSFFNPLWGIIFGIEFSWSWLFIFCLLFWIAIIVIVYEPAKEIFSSNSILALVASIIIACLAGLSGGINETAKMAALFVKNIWVAIISTIIIILILVLYEKMIKQYKEKMRKEKLKMSEELMIVKGDMLKEEMK